jgi:hypothetical protein
MMVGGCKSSFCQRRATLDSLCKCGRTVFFRVTLEVTCVAFQNTPLGKNTVNRPFADPSNHEHGFAHQSTRAHENQFRPSLHAIRCPPDRDSRRPRSRHADIIKLWLDDFYGANEPKMSPEISRAIIDEAHKNGLRAAAHIFYLEDAKRLLREGLDAIRHSVRDVPADQEFIVLEASSLMTSARRYASRRCIMTAGGLNRGSSPSKACRSNRSRYAFRAGLLTIAFRRLPGGGEQNRSSRARSAFRTALSQPGVRFFHRNPQSIRSGFG